MSGASNAADFTHRVPVILIQMGGACLVLGVPVSGAWCMESAALVAPLTNRVPVTHHKTVVCTCHWCAATKFPAGIKLVQTVVPD